MKYFLLFVENVRGLISCLNDQQLANFCRILAVAISDLDIYENKSSCKSDVYQYFCNEYVVLIVFTTFVS